MNLAKYLQTTTIAIILALPQFFPEIIRVPFRVRIILFILLVFVILAIFTNVYWSRWFTRWTPLLSPILKFFTNTSAKITYVLFSSGAIIYTSKFSSSILYLVLFIDLVYFSSVSWFPIRKKVIYSEKYKDRLAKWILITGNVQLENDFGNPKSPDIILRKDEIAATNTFIVHKDLELEDGVIECDYYLEPEAILNLVVFVDTKKQNWYMARYDSRNNETDSILIQDAGPGAHWRHDSRGDKGNSLKRSWQHARVEFSKSSIKMYRDSELVAEVSNPQMPGKRIGLFNEVNDVHIDNLIVTRL